MEGFIVALIVIAVIVFSIRSMVNDTKRYVDQRKARKSPPQSPSLTIETQFLVQSSSPKSAQQVIQETRSQPNSCFKLPKAYYTYLEDIAKLKRENQYSEAEALLLDIIHDIELTYTLTKNMEYPEYPPPHYYTQLAIIYRKAKRYHDELAILRRWESFGIYPNNMANSINTLKNRIIKVEQLILNS